MPVGRVLTKLRLNEHTHTSIIHIRPQRCKHNAQTASCNAGGVHVVASSMSRHLRITYCSNIEALKKL